MVCPILFGIQQTATNRTCVYVVITLYMLICYYIHVLYVNLVDLDVQVLMACQSGQAIQAQEANASSALRWATMFGERSMSFKGQSLWQPELCKLAHS